MQIILRQNDTISPNQFIFYTIDMVIHILLPPISGGIFLVVERMGFVQLCRLRCVPLRKEFALANIVRECDELLVR